MKKVTLSILLIAAMLVLACKNENKQEESLSAGSEELSEEITETIAMSDISFGVRGNCGMCKSTIEKAAHGVEGVAEANWDVDRKKIAVSYDPSATDEITIHNAIADSGYDTEKVPGNEEAYSNLPKCCQYDHEMLMNQEVAEGQEGNHHSSEDPHMEEAHENNDH